MKSDLNLFFSSLFFVLSFLISSLNLELSTCISSGHAQALNQETDQTKVQSKGDDMTSSLSHRKEIHLRIQKLIQYAVSEGSPLYNQGQVEACIALYRTTLKAILFFDPSSPYRSYIEALLKIIQTQNPQKAAWNLRYLLDQMERSPQPILDFNHIQSWSTVNDSVMGGISKGSMIQEQKGIGLFQGQLSLENRGGFSSTRLPVFLGMFADKKGVKIRVRGDHHRYTFLVSNDSTRGSWQKDFVVSAEWQEIWIPFAEMTLSIRGWNPPNAPDIDPASITRLGFLIKDKDIRPFRLEIDLLYGE